MKRQLISLVVVTAILAAISIAIVKTLPKTKQAPPANRPKTEAVIKPPKLVCESAGVKIFKEQTGRQRMYLINTNDYPVQLHEVYYGLYSEYTQWIGIMPAGQGFYFSGYTDTHGYYIRDASGTRLLGWVKGK